MNAQHPLEEKFRETGGKRAYVQRLFGRIARIYDLLNRLMSFGLDRRWRAFAARRLALSTGEVGLDLGTGTADLSIAVIRRSKPGTRSEEHTSELQSRVDLVCRLLLEK